MILFAAWILLFIAYSMLIFYYWRSWKSIPGFLPGKSPRTKVTVIIPARNEEENIISCLDSVCNQDYPAGLLQVIVLDDSSTDKTWEKLHGYHHPEKQILKTRLTEVRNGEFSAYKKRAIDTGVKLADGDLIVTTDADCKHSPLWIKTIASFYEEKNAVFIAAPVVLSCNASLFQIFQAMDFMVLQGITGASVHKNFHTMCNGANLAYTKTAFIEVNGFSGIDHIASGDDMLLMHKIEQKFHGRVLYLKSPAAIVHSLPQHTWKDFFNQRIRWASKAPHYQDKRLFRVLLLVYFFNLSFLALFIAGFFHYKYWVFLTAGWLLKTLVELPFFSSVARFYNKQWMIKLFLLFQPLHIAYTIVAGWLGQFGKYEWKDRKVS